ncbi:MAG: hypothetical protein RR576_01250, partial [Oscillospiraceae bacterium]
TAGTSDLEMETGRILMTDAQFYVRMITSGLMLVGGSIGVRVCNIIAVRKHRHKALKMAYRKHSVVKVHRESQNGQR